MDPYGGAPQHSFQACVFVHLLYIPRPGIADLSNESESECVRERERGKGGREGGRGKEREEGLICMYMNGTHCTHLQYINYILIMFI